MTKRTSKSKLAASGSRNDNAVVGPAIDQSLARRVAAALDQVQAELSAHVVRRTAKERQTSLRPIPDTEKVAAEVVKVAEHYDVALRDLGPREVIAAVTVADNATLVQQAAERVAAMLADNAGAARAHLWRSTLDLYQALRIEARRDPEIARALEPIQQRLAIGKAGTLKRKVAAAGAALRKQGGRAAEPAVVAVETAAPAQKGAPN